MIALTLNNIERLNVSMQVGDLVYATTAFQTFPTGDRASINTVGEPMIVGILRRITTNGGVTVLDIDNTSNPLGQYVPQPADFIMFSKYSQTDGDVIGYYAEAQFKNNSKTKAELFSVGSEVVINSK